MGEAARRRALGLGPRSAGEPHAAAPRIQARERYLAAREEQLALEKRIREQLATERRMQAAQVMVRTTESRPRPFMPQPRVVSPIVLQRDELNSAPSTVPPPVFRASGRGRRGTE